MDISVQPLSPTAGQFSIIGGVSPDASPPSPYLIGGVDISISPNNLFRKDSNVSRSNDVIFVISNLFFLGNSYQTVSDPEKYLEFCYGDWQTPKKTANKKEYLTLEHQPRLKMYNIFFQKIKNLFVKLKK